MACLMDTWLVVMEICAWVFLAEFQIGILNKSHEERERKKESKAKPKV